MFPSIHPKAVATVYLTTQLEESRIPSSRVAWLTPDLIVIYIEVWEPHINFLVFEARFMIAESRLLGATNVYHMSLYVAHRQSYQLYQMTYVERQKFDDGEHDGCVESSSSSSNLCHSAYVIFYNWYDWLWATYRLIWETFVAPNKRLRAIVNHARKYEKMNVWFPDLFSM